MALQNHMSSDMSVSSMQSSISQHRTLLDTCPYEHGLIRKSNVCIVLGALGLTQEEL